MSKAVEEGSVQFNSKADPDTPGVHGHGSLLERIGVKAALLMVGGLVVEIAAIAFISFLWYGTNDNNVWHKIVINNWTTRSVTLTALALRLSMAVQGAACLSMLAAITVEKLSVPVVNVADISLMRAGNKTDLLSVVSSYLWPVWRKGSGPGKVRYGTLALVFGILATTTLSQFASTALVSDLAQRQIPGVNNTTPVLFNYEFTNASASAFSLRAASQLLSADESHRYGYFYNWLSESSFWTGKTPLFWPTFAEYSEPPHEAKEVDDTGVDDTGPSLRAFLPLGSGQDRQNIRNYTGKALVYDSRVTCQKPKMSGVTWDRSGIDVNAGLVLGLLAGNVSSTTTTPRMAKPISDAAFQCVTSMGFKVLNFNATYWTVCELKAPYMDYNPLYDADDLDFEPWQEHPVQGLTSQFRAESGNITGAAFLLITPSSEIKGYPPEARVATGDDSPFVKITVDKPVIDNDAPQGPTALPEEYSVKDYTVTLCLASQDVADRYVEAYSGSNRTEPSANYNASKGTFEFGDVVRQLGVADGGENLTHEQRGVLNLKPRSDWTASSPNQLVLDGPEQIPYVTGGVHSSNTATGNWNMVPYLLRAVRIQGGLIGGPGIVNVPSWSAIMARLSLGDSDVGGLPTGINATGYAKTGPYNAVCPEDWMLNLIDSLAAKKPAAALQALLTSVVGAAYYERLAQYDKPTNASQVFYVVRESPGGPYGQKRKGMATGFLAVLVVLMVHLILIAVVIIRFATLSRLTRIGDGWQSIAHIALSEESRPIIQVASATGTAGGRKAVQEVVESDRIKGLRIGLGPDEHGSVRFRRV